VLPLANRRVLITRTRQQASELASQLAALGAQTVTIPTIEIAPPTSFCALDAALACLSCYDWLLFTSANAVHAFQQRAECLSIQPHPCRIAAIGPATAKAVADLGLRPQRDTILVPPQYVAESLAEALTPHAAGQTFLLVRAEEARDILPDTLTAAGAHVTIAPAYRNVTPPEAIPSLQALFAAATTPPDAITFTSSSTARNLLALLETAAITLPSTVVLASIGPITSATLRELGYEPTVEAAEPTVPALAEAIANHFAH
jgi:uroporphyrinogen-III synthase